MHSLGRREFIEWGALATLSLGGCAGTRELLSPSEPISPTQMDDYLLRLDHSMAAILDADGSLNGLLPSRSQRAVQGHDRAEAADRQFRKTMRSLLITGSFRDLPERAQLHPGMQQRLWNAAPEISEVIASNHAYLSSLLPAQKADLDLRLCDQPDLTRRLAEGMDADALRLGVPHGQRQHLRALLQQIDFRLRHQSVAAVCDEYLEKVQRLQSRDASVEAQQRQWIARLGEQAFWDYRKRLEDAHHSWTGGVATGGAAGSASTGMGPVIMLGGLLVLGVGVALTTAGVLLVSQELGWAFGITLGILGLVAGVIMLIAGAVEWVRH